MKKKSDFNFGSASNYRVGDVFESRKQLSESGIHAPLQHGIWGRESEGACSIVLSGGYEDDILAALRISRKELPPNLINLPVVK